MRRDATIRAALTAAVLLGAVDARADQWNERINLSFSSPVMVPGATLPAGTYVFELVNTNSNRQVVRIRRESDLDPIALAQAVPLKRAETSGDAVLQFNPTDTQAPPAIKAWFYPGSRYGHEFIYPEEQARHIAERTKTVVLSIDVPGSDLEKGVLWTHDATGNQMKWRGDEQTLREWDAFQRGRGSSADADELKRGTATALRSDFEGRRIELDELEEDPQKYMGQRISVDGEVEEIFGPRLFTIDEPHWGDLDGEILVLLPTPLAALVKDDDRVTISGTVRPFVRAEIEREWGWLGLDPKIEGKVTMKPVLVAERLIGGDDNTALVIDTTASEPGRVGTTGSARELTDATAVGAGDVRLVGQPISLNNARVTGNASGSGFFIDAGDRRLFVLPSRAGTMVASGDTVSLRGVILRMPRHMEQRLNAPPNVNDHIYVYATSVGK